MCNNKNIPKIYSSPRFKLGLTKNILRIVNSINGIAIGENKSQSLLAPIFRLNPNKIIRYIDEATAKNNHCGSD